MSTWLTWRKPAFLLCLALTAGVVVLFRSPRPQLVRVSGSVTLDGQPLAGALVSMKPVMGTARSDRPAHATTDSDGQFRPVCYGDATGIPRGRYKVAVRKQQLPDELNLEAPATVPVLITWLTPRFYADPESSGLEVSVTSAGMEPSVLALQSIGPPEVENSGIPWNYDDP